MRTKEEIFSNYEPQNDAWIYTEEDTYSAMDEYAKEVAIDFSLWVSGYENITQAKRFWHCQTIEQLFEIFKKKTTYNDKQTTL